MQNYIGLYIHIPFCKSKCPYCDFFSGKASDDELDVYVAELLCKLEYWSNQTNKQVATVYFGGGTPSVLGTERLTKVMIKTKECFTLTDNCEITLEVNPESGKELDFSFLKKVGFNRISMGMQSADSQELKMLGRIHGTDDAKMTVKNAQRAGINNISLDLMMGVPCQTIESLKKSIDFCNSCGVQHISSYILKIEKNTWYDRIKDTLCLPDEDMQAEMYLYAVDYLDKLGFKQYEISNFAKLGFESRHNTNYWKCGEYIGIGPSAHSFLNGKRFYYDRSIKDFYDNKIVDDGTGGDEEEFVMLSLRLKSGLNFEEYKIKYKKELDFNIKNKLKNYIKVGYMEQTENGVCLTPKGYLVSNAIISDLI